MHSSKTSELKKVLYKTLKIEFSDLLEFKQQLISAGSLMDEKETEMKALWLELSKELEHYQQEINDLKEEFADRLKAYISEPDPSQN